MLPLILFTIVFVLTHTTTLTYEINYFVLRANIGIVERTLYFLLALGHFAMTLVGAWFLAGCFQMHLARSL
jgi:hypothetical protein